MGYGPGAAWAGALGVMAIIVAAKRTDWLLRLPAIVAISAIGWGVGGSMSYIHIVGYAWVKDFANVYYGLAMLGVISALWAFVGGGFSAYVWKQQMKKTGLASSAHANDCRRHIDVSDFDCALWLENESAESGILGDLSGRCWGIGLVFIPQWLFQGFTSRRLFRFWPRLWFCFRKFFANVGKRFRHCL